VIFNAPGYLTDTVSNVIVTDSNTTRLDHVMKKNMTNISWNVTSMPGQYRLQQNFPNPFNPLTSIRFDVPLTGHVSLVIYDNLGKVTATLVNSVLNSGSYEVKWNGSDFPSGIFFCKIVTDNFEETMKMIMVK
jgi:hypothetical protein